MGAPTERLASGFVRVDGNVKVNFKVNVNKINVNVKG